MIGQQFDYELGQWTARAADSYQELARVFSSYVTEHGRHRGQETDYLVAQMTDRLCSSCPKQEWCDKVCRKEREEAVLQAVKYMDIEGHMTETAFPIFSGRSASGWTSWRKFFNWA